MKSRHGSMHKKLERADSALRINSNFVPQGPPPSTKDGGTKSAICDSAPTISSEENNDRENISYQYQRSTS